MKKLLKIYAVGQNMGPPLTHAEYNLSLQVKIFIVNFRKLVSSLDMIDMILILMVCLFIVKFWLFGSSQEEWKQAVQCEGLLFCKQRDALLGVSFTGNLRLYCQYCLTTKLHDQSAILKVFAIKAVKMWQEKIPITCRNATHYSTHCFVELANK